MVVFDGRLCFFFVVGCWLVVYWKLLLWFVWNMCLWLCLLLWVLWLVLFEWCFWLLLCCWWWSCLMCIWVRKFWWFWLSIYLVWLIWFIVIMLMCLFMLLRVWLWCRWRVVSLLCWNWVRFFMRVWMICIWLDVMWVGCGLWSLLCCCWRIRVCLCLCWKNNWFVCCCVFFLKKCGGWCYRW